MTQFDQITEMTERVLFIHVATAIHAAAIASPEAPASITDSVTEAADLIAACDEFLGVDDDEEPSEP